MRTLRTGSGAPRRRRHNMRLWGLFAAVPLTVLLAPTGVAWTAEELNDTQGPSITLVEIIPDPVLPGPVEVRATAVDDESLVVGGEYFVDDPSSGTPVTMDLADGVADRTTENLTWNGTYDSFAPGPHTIYVHALDAAGNWGVFGLVRFLVGDPSTVGPAVEALTVTPTNVPRGAAMTINASIASPFQNSTVASAEFFVDDVGPDGQGTALEGTFGNRTVGATWTGIPLLPPGDHTVHVHARNDVGLWGAFAMAAFTSRVPNLTLRLLVGGDTARPGENVTYAVIFENAGNANATVAWVNVTLPPALVYDGDDAETLAAFSRRDVDRGTLRFAFVNVTPDGHSFRIRTHVWGGATDEASLNVTAILDYTNDVGWNFPTASANTSGTVVAPAIRAAIIPPETVHPGENVTLIVQVHHFGKRIVPSVDVTLSDSHWSVTIGDTAASEGGTKVGDRAWRFTDLTPGLHTFHVTEQIVPTAGDGLVLAWNVEVSYVSRFGAVTTFLASASSQISRPVLVASVEVDRRQAEIGDRITFAVRLRNEGSSSATEIQVAVVLPLSLVRVGGDPPATSTGVRHVWTLEFNLSPGDEPFRPVVLVVEGRAPGTFQLTVEVTYRAGPDALPLGPVIVPSTVVVHPGAPPLATIFAVLAAIGVAVGAGGFLATERGRCAVLFALAPVYGRSRGTREDEEGIRAGIRDHLRAYPGSSYGTIRTALRVRNGPLAYHLSVLEKENFVRSVKRGKFRRFYSADGQDKAP